MAGASGSWGDAPQPGVLDSLPDNIKKKYKNKAIKSRMPGGADMGAFQLFLKDQLSGK